MYREMSRPSSCVSAYLLGPILGQLVDEIMKDEDNLFEAGQGEGAEADDRECYGSTTLKA